MNRQSSADDILCLTVKIVTAHVANNVMPTGALPALIGGVYQALVGADSHDGPPTLRPAVPVKRSVTADSIICLEDGRRFKMLKRHLKAAYNLTPAQYRRRWGLAPDYPMVAPNYAKRRSVLARQSGLGTRPVIRVKAR